MIADPAAGVAAIVAIAVIVYVLVNVVIFIVTAFEWAITALRRRRVDRWQRELLRRETERELIRFEADAAAAVRRIEMAFLAAQQALRSGRLPVNVSRSHCE